MMGLHEPFLGNDLEDGGNVEVEESSSDQNIVQGEPSVPVGKIVTRGVSLGSPRIEVVKRIYRRLWSSHRISSEDELRRFQTSLFFLGLDQSTPTRLTFSWILFVIFTIIVPGLVLVYVSCKNCDSMHSHPFQQLVDCSESALGAVSFLCLSQLLHKYGLKKTLLLDKLGSDPIAIRYGYENELHKSFTWLAYILVPCCILKLVHQVWWYLYVSVEIPFLSRTPVLDVIFCTATVLAWLYRSVVFLSVCLLFRLMCSLQLLRLHEYITLLKETSDIATILKEHMRIRDQLLMISHRYRIFVILSMFTITFSQLTSLFVITDSENAISFLTAGDLVVCSIVQLSGFVLCLHGAAKITHRAQRIMSIMSQWHAVATCWPLAVSSFEDVTSPASRLGPAHPSLYNASTGDLENTIDVTSRPMSHVPHDVQAFQQRQALMEYFEFANAGISLYGVRLDRHFLSSMFDNFVIIISLDYLQFANAGISLYGFVLDRGFLFAVFGIEFSLTLFILGKTILN